MPGKFGTTVCQQIFWGAALFDELIENAAHVLTLEALSDLNGQALARKYVNDRQGTELLPVAELIVDEVQAPRLLGSLWLATCLTLHDHLTPARSF